MQIETLIEFCNPITVGGNHLTETGKLCHDSREVKPGDIFIAVKGLRSDGHNFIPEAVGNGAGVIIIEKDLDIPESVLKIVVGNTRKLIGPLSQMLAGNPAEQLTIIGVTGTNGKTTVATLIWQVLTNLGYPASLLGTVEKRVNRKVFKSRLTTADPIELAEDMKQMVDAGSKYLVMEVSSHALDQMRVKGIPFTVAVFTNLSHDHLDYHESMNEYASAKKKLFNSLNNKSWAITNLDDSRGEWMINSTPAKVLSFSFKNKGLFKAELISSDASGSVIELDGIRIETPLVGLFNAYNVAQVMLACTALGLDGPKIAAALKRCPGAPGRMERVLSTSKGPVVFVDYAHTPNALENVASTLKELKKDKQRLIIIFGCGGDRDTSKRPVMATVAEQYADKVVVTSDNPRSEDPDAIIDDIMQGFKIPDNAIRIPSREQAISQTVGSATENSIVLIAGKGHETYQEVHGVRNHFDDREIAKQVLDSRNNRNQKEKVR